MTKPISRLHADFYLLLATVAWGITFPLIHQAMGFISPSLFVFFRFGLASLILLPFLLRALIHADPKTFYFGIVLGGINTSIYLLQATGMKTVPAAEGSFIAGINVIIVPVLLPFFKMGRPQLKDFLSALICLCGIFVLTNAGLNHLPLGVYWIILSSFSVALSLLFLQKFTQMTPHLDALAFFQVLTTVFLISPFTFTRNHLSDFHAVLHLAPLMSIAFCAIFATSFALLVQTRYQHFTNPARAALIFSLEPVFASLFSHFINGEALSLRLISGGSIILISIFISECWHFIKKP